MIRSPLLDGAGFSHAFGTRTDDEARIPSALGVASERTFRPRQVHGSAVHVVGEADVPAAVSIVEADALVAREGDLAVAVVTADCVPVLVADPASGRVAAVHAGWRGVEAGVLRAALARLADLGSDPARLVASIGPHIRACCFEVGDDVALRLRAASCAVDRSRDRPRVDLASGLRAALAAAGVTAVDDVGGCTRCEPRRFHSYRRRGPRAGRQLSVIASGVRRTG